MAETKSFGAQPGSDQAQGDVNAQDETNRAAKRLGDNGQGRSVAPNHIDEEDSVSANWEQ